MKLIDAAYEADPGSHEAAFCFATLMLESSHPGPARTILEWLAEKNPDKWQAHQNLGRALQEFDLDDESEASFRRALELNPKAIGALVGMSCVATHRHDWDGAMAWADKALASEWNLQAEINKAFAYLSRGEFGRGWDLYVKGVGHMKWRDKHNYGLKDWEGGKGKVLFYAEQGMGDQLAFCSAIPDALDVTAGINCNPKLETLLRYSLPTTVHGDQFVEEVPWVYDTGATHQAPMSMLAKVYRRTAEAFPKRAYLKVPDDREYQWRALLDRISDRPKIGIAWTGGIKGSAGSANRNLTLDQLAPIFGLDADFINLEYRDTPLEGRAIHDFPWATRTEDYMDTACMVKALDAVVCVPTTVYHLAGGLGVPAHVIVHEKPHFHEKWNGGSPWWDVQFHRREELGTEGAIESVRESLCASLSV